MTEHIAHIFLLALVSIGVCSTMWEGMVFERVGDMIEETVGEYWAKPLGKCYICTSFWIAVIVCLIVQWPWWYPFATLGFTAMVSLFVKDE